MAFSGKIKSFLVLPNTNVSRSVIFFVNKSGYFIVGMNNIYENYWNSNFAFFLFLITWLSLADGFRAFLHVINSKLPCALDKEQ